MVGRICMKHNFNDHQCSVHYPVHAERRGDSRGVEARHGWSTAFDFATLRSGRTAEYRSLYRTQLQAAMSSCGLRFRQRLILYRPRATMFL